MEGLYIFTYPPQAVCLHPQCVLKWRLSFLLTDVWLFLTLNCTRWIKTSAAGPYSLLVKHVSPPFMSSTVSGNVLPVSRRWLNTRPFAYSQIKRSLTWVCRDDLKSFVFQHNRSQRMERMKRDGMPEATSVLPETRWEFVHVFQGIYFFVRGRYSCLVLRTGADFNFDPRGAVTQFELVDT